MAQMALDFNASSLQDAFDHKAENNDNSSYENHVLNNIRLMVNDNNLSDVTFIVEGEELCGIRALFASQSIVFKNMLYGRMIESNPSCEVILNDITTDAFKYLRNTFYNVFDNKTICTNSNSNSNPDRNVNLTSSIVVDVLFASQKYLIKPLTKKCINFIKNIKNINDFYTILNTFESSSFRLQSNLYLNEIINNSPPYILQNECLNFFKNEKFKYLKISTVILFLNSDYLSIEEHQIWDTLLKWIKYNSLLIDDNQKQKQNANQSKCLNNLCKQFEEEKQFETQFEKHVKQVKQPQEKEREFISKFIPYIRFSKMNIHYFREYIVEKCILSNNDIIQIMFNREDSFKYKTRFNDKSRKINNYFNGSNKDVFSLNQLTLSLNEIRKLSVGDSIDFRDFYGLFCAATIIDVKHNQNKIKIHYNSWSNSYDEWYVYYTDLYNDDHDDAIHGFDDNENENDENDNDNDYSDGISNGLRNRIRDATRRIRHNDNDIDDDDDDKPLTINNKRRYERIGKYRAITNRKIKRECYLSQFNTTNHIEISVDCEVNLPIWFFKKNENSIVNYRKYYNKWIRAQIISYRILKKYSQHVKIRVMINDDPFEYWIHPDNYHEIRPIPLN